MSEIKFEKCITENGTQAAAVLDVQGWWHGNVTNYEELDKKIQGIYDMGLRRVYVVSSDPGFPQFSNNWCGRSSLSKFDSTVETFRKMGFAAPDHAIPEICHKKGMECFAVFKCYEGGGMENIPFGSKYDPSFEAFEGFGGLTVQLDSFLTENLKKGKDYRVCRRNDGANDNLQGTADRITVDFISGAFVRPERADRRERMAAIGALSEDALSLIADGKTYTNQNHHPNYGIRVWVSDDNRRYRLYDKDYSYSYIKGKKVLKDANGDEMYENKPVETVTLEIKGLAIDENFVALSFDNTKNLRVDPLSFQHLWAGNREIYTSKTDFVRRADFEHDENPEDYVWGQNATPIAYGSLAGIPLVDGKLVGKPIADNEPWIMRAAVCQRFPLYGFEFNFEPYAGFVRSWGVGVMAMGRGAEKTFPGGHCEAYPEVREYWLSHLDELLSTEYDGIVVRLQHHSSIATDFKNYGFNQPITDKYLELYGKEAHKLLLDPSHHITDEEYIRIMKIRGDFFMLFAEEAVKHCHAKNKEFAVMLREYYCEPRVCSTQNEATWWCMPKILPDWKKVVQLSDFVHIKDYIHHEEDVQINAKEIRTYGKALGKKVWIECYDDQAKMFTDKFFENAVADKAIDGVLLYELTHVEKYRDNGLAEQLKAWGFSSK